MSSRVRKPLHSKVLNHCYIQHESSAIRTFLPIRVTQRVTLILCNERPKFRRGSFVSKKPGIVRLSEKNADGLRRTRRLRQGKAGQKLNPNRASQPLRFSA